MIATVGVSDFVKRQTPESSHAHFDGTWQELLALVEAQWPNRHPSPHHTEVMLVPVPEAESHRFYTSVITVNALTSLEATFEPRRPGEDAFIQVHAKGTPKQPAQSVEIILYSHQVLEKDGEAPQPKVAEFYIISINAYSTKVPDPMHPITMARNFLGLAGGTVPEKPYSAEEFARAIVYWTQHARLQP